MLQHVIEAQVLNLILGSMNLLIRVRKLALDDKRRGVSGSTGTSMITTRITTFRFDVGYVAVLRDDRLDEFRETRVDEVGDDADGLGFPRGEGAGDVAGHVLLQHGLDVALLRGVRGEDGAGAEEAALFGRVPVELDRVWKGGAVGEGGGGEEDAEGFEDGDGAGAVVVGARGAEEGGEEEVDGVLVGADDDGFVAAAWDGGDYAGLGPGVGEGFDVGAALVGAGAGYCFVDGGEEPL